MSTHATARPRAHGTPLMAVLIAVWTGSAGSCGPESKSLSTRSQDPATGAGSSVGTSAGASKGVSAQDDWGTDWAQAADRPAAAATAGSGTVWTIVLATFPPEGGQQTAAENMVRQLRTVVPDLEHLWVHSTRDGTIVCSGRYDSPRNSDAQADLQRIKAIEIRDRPAFARAMLTRIKLRPVAAGLHPYALMSVRLRYPTTDPLYTLEVGIWSDFESGELTLGEIRRKAEAQARELRGRGYEAYFFHDDDKRISVVTVGIFDHTAIDQRTGLYGPQLQSLMGQFPAHLVNGERLLEPIDGRNPARGTRVQKPRPVLIPKP